MIVRRNWWLSLLALTALLAVGHTASALSPPTNLTASATPTSITLGWQPPADGGQSTVYNVFRNGLQVASGLPEPPFQDGYLAPDTPAVYVVEAFDAGTTARSAPFGARTAPTSWEIWVPGMVPTLQQALSQAGPGTTIRLEPGRYRWPEYAVLQPGVTVRGEDPNACVIEAGPMPIELSGAWGPQTLSNLTVEGAVVRTGLEDTLDRCVLPDGTDGSGLVAHSVYPNPYGTAVYVSGPFILANSIVFSSMGPIGDLGSGTFLNNDFPAFSGGSSLPGSGNFSSDPQFACGYELSKSSPCLDQGFPLGEAGLPVAPDVGAFEVGLLHAPPPVNGLRVEQTTPDSVVLSWAGPTGTACQGLSVNLLRDGRMVGSAGVPWSGRGTSWDGPLAAGTPHVYTVQSYSPYSPIPSAPSNHVAGRTPARPSGDMAYTLRVPDQYPTIAAAITAAQSRGPVTISVAPGTYKGSFNLGPLDGATLRCQDANVCVLEAEQQGQPVVDLGPTTYAGNTLSGFTVRGGPVLTGPASVVVNCVFPNDGVLPDIQGSGFIANSTFDAPYSGAASIAALWGQPLTVANSLFLGGAAIEPRYGNDQVTVLHNDFASDPWWVDFGGGEGNFSAFPAWTVLAPPLSYFVTSYSPTVDKGMDFGPFPVYGLAPDVGAFEYGQVYGARPPTALTATWVPAMGAVELTWTPSPDASFTDQALPQVHGYVIYRAQGQDPVVSPELPPYGYAGTPNFVDTYAIPDTEYRYAVVADCGTSLEGSPVRSVPTNVAAVTPVMPLPTANPDAFTGYEDQPLEVPGPGVLVNDSDPLGSTLYAELVEPPTPGGFTLNGDGSFSYQPPPDFSGTVTFQYRAHGVYGSSAPATVTLTIQEVLEVPPVAVDDAAGTLEDTAVEIDVMANDYDPDGYILWVQSLTQPAHGTTDFSYAVNGIRYTPAPDFFGTDSFTYTVMDGDGLPATAAVTVTVMPVNDPPSPVSDWYFVDEDGVLSVPAEYGVLANDTDPDGDLLTATLAGGPAHGTLSLSPNGSLQYRPDPNFSGTDYFGYFLSDGKVTTGGIAVQIEVMPVNDAPVGAPDSFTVAEDAVLNVPAPGLLANDGDPDGDALNVILQAPPAHGELFLGVNGSFSYAPGPNFHGTDTFSYVTRDANLASPPVTVTIAVTPVNDGPTANPGSLSTVEDTAAALTLTGSDPEGDPLTYTVTAGPLHGTLSGTAPNLTYAPAANYSGPDSLTFQVSDGTLTSSAATVSITVTPVNDAPTAYNGTLSTTEDTPRGVTLGATDPDGDALGYSVVSGPTHGTLSGTAPNLTYSPAANYSGPDSFTFEVSDGSLESTATVAITVTSLNDAPTANPTSVSTAEDAAVAVTLTGSDPEGDALSFSVVSGPSHGTLTGTVPDLTYTPAANYSGPDSFTFEVSDGSLTSAATVSITVDPVNDAPTADPLSASTAEDTATAITLTGSDPEADPLTYMVVSVPNHGTLTGAAPNLTYNPEANYSGPDSFTFEVSDGSLTSVATVAIDVTAVNDAPTANAGRDQTGTVGKALSFSGADSSDVDGTVVDYAWNWGDGTADGGGVGAEHTYAAAGTYTVTLTVTDDAGAMATSTLTVTVEVNLALNKPATASSTRKGYEAKKAVDGSAATSWMSSKSSTAQWVRVDLGSIQSISRVKIVWPDTYFARAFRIETSANGKAWAEVYSTSSGDGSATDVTFTAASVRYVRVTCTTPNNASYYGVAELEVYQ